MHLSISEENLIEFQTVIIKKSGGGKHSGSTRHYDKSMLPTENPHIRRREEAFPEECDPMSPPATPPVRMPESPNHIQQADLEYALTVCQLESKEWDMWELLSSHGLNVQSPEHEPCMAFESPPRMHGFEFSADTEMFHIDL
mmetsp:Transcript_66689/g.134430  ORF Transcript_66689/g.134430 Transcript_66689/m.134430 type:complete len:142 (+) Transcript_66689:58-483(+)